MNTFIFKLSIDFCFCYCVLPVCLIKVVAVEPGVTNAQVTLTSGPVVLDGVTYRRNDVMNFNLNQYEVMSLREESNSNYDISGSKVNLNIVFPWYIIHMGKTQTQTQMHLFGRKYKTYNFLDVHKHKTI